MSFQLQSIQYVGKGPLEIRTVWMPQAGMNTTMHNHKIYILIVSPVPTSGPQVVNREVLNLTALSMNWNEPHHLE